MDLWLLSIHYFPQLYLFLDSTRVDLHDSQFKIIHYLILGAWCSTRQQL